ncbi:peptidoglycan editing factor PgeF [Vibrio maerlii]|uniref:peptidoglycan editing factor PgeF n=1 Tax=Vibrio maerlii TaxID=2231648 RepID=UPI000E3DAB67|nr:peptidoglycan editing factor PgeF [Vibrio maerlii]
MIIPNWNAPENVRAISTTRAGGFSIGVYQGLNLGNHVGDESEVVLQNRQEVVKLANMPSSPIWLNQTHSNVVLSASEPLNAVQDADACFTETNGVVCSAMTADCLPILLTNDLGTQVAAVHAGWRGLANGIVENAVAKFTEGQIMAWVGPAISQSAFEVGDDVVNAFIQHDSQAISAFEEKPQPGKWLANMTLLVEQRLNSVGVTNVTQSGLCTFKDDEQFYSYRRDGITGRQASFIWLD